MTETPAAPNCDDQARSDAHEQPAAQPVEGSVAEAPDSRANTPVVRQGIFTPEFTKMIADSYPKMDWKLGVPAGTMSIINDAVKMEASWLNSSAELTAGLVNILPASRSFGDLFGSTPRWMDTAARLSSSIEGLFPLPIIPQSVIDSLGASLPALDLAPSTIAALGALSDIPALNLPSWFEPLVAQSEMFRNAVEIANLGLVYDLPAALLKLAPFVDLPTLAEIKRHLPSNWHAVDVEPGDIEAEVREILEEGIPLAWIPESRVIELLLDASGRAARQQVILNNHRGILTSCEELAGSFSSPRALNYADTVRKAVHAFRDGHTEAAQALASNLMDTIVTHHTEAALGRSKGALLNQSAYMAHRKKGWRHTLALHPLTTVMASGSHTVESPTRAYNRNATVHALTRQQYTRINAVLAIMNATAILTCFIRDTPAFD